MSLQSTEHWGGGGGGTTTEKTKFISMCSACKIVHSLQSAISIALFNLVY
jgi:hypothetical protein